MENVFPSWFLTMTRFFPSLAGPRIVTGLPLGRVGPGAGAAGAVAAFAGLAALPGLAGLATAPVGQGASSSAGAGAAFAGLAALAGCVGGTGVSAFASPCFGA